MVLKEVRKVPIQKKKNDKEQRYTLVDELVVKLLRSSTIVYDSKHFTVYKHNGINYGVNYDNNDNVLSINVL